MKNKKNSVSPAPKKDEKGTDLSIPKGNKKVSEHLTSKNKKQDLGFPLSSENFIIIAIAVALIIIGFFLVSGGGSKDPNVFSKDIFSFRRITLAPIVMLLGYGLVIYGIMRKPKHQ